ncbi:ADP-ribose diphosphatase, partial [Vibrio parahaemolyticus]|nr:ADP-ribose diphosphatase [Vibrio parahaemolyticus]
MQQSERSPGEFTPNDVEIVSTETLFQGFFRMV